MPEMGLDQPFVCRSVLAGAAGLAPLQTPQPGFERAAEHVGASPARKMKVALISGLLGVIFLLTLLLKGESVLV